MWLSWVRALHTVDGTLRLSRPLFRAIKEWGGREGDGEGRGWGNVQWIPVLPDKQQQQQRQRRRGEGVVDGKDGPAAVAAGSDTVDVAVGVGTAITGRGQVVAAGTKVEPCAVSNVEEKGANSTLETEKGEEVTQVQCGGVGGKRENREERKVGDTISVAAANAEDAAKGGCTPSGGRTLDGEINAEPMMLKAKQDERAKVLELVEKLVADFGRFPLAEREWEGVEEGSEKVGRDLCSRGDESAPAESPADGGAAAGPRCDNACSADDGDGCGGINGGGTGSKKGEPSACGHSNADDTLRREKAQNVEVSKGDGGSNTTNDSRSVATRKALTLKAEGNESYRTGDLEAARDAYTRALDIMKASAGATPPQSPMSQSNTSKDSPEETSRVEAAVLWGVLHRNRAAVALRMFESKATAEAAAASTRDAGATTAHHTGDATTRNGSGRAPPRGNSFGRTTNGSIDLHSQPASGAKNLPAHGSDPHLLSGKENGHRAKETDDARLTLELSLALLEGCEGDCLKAIEVDAGDKKARLRLDRCRELRRRCYRTGLASAAVDREGRSTGYSRQDERYKIKSNLKQPVKVRLQMLSKNKKELLEPCRICGTCWLTPKTWNGSSPRCCCGSAHLAKLTVALPRFLL